MRKPLGIAALVAAAIAVAFVLMPNSVYYRNGRPTRVGRAVSRAQAIWSGLGLPPRFQVALEVPRRSGAGLQSVPVVIAEVEGERYLVSMLGERSDWVKNVRAAGGEATIRSGSREPVLLEEVPVEERAPALKAYVKRAFGARPHFDPGPDSPLEEFEAVAANYPVFRIRPR